MIETFFTASFLAIMFLVTFFFGYFVGSRYSTRNTKTGESIQHDAQSAITSLKEKILPPRVIIHSPYKESQAQAMQKDLESI